MKTPTSNSIKQSFILLLILLPLFCYTQQTIKVFGKIQHGHPLYDVSNAICDELETSGKFPHMAVVYSKLKQATWEKTMPVSFGPKIRTELLCDCDTYLRDIIKYTEPANHEKWSAAKRKSYELAHLVASTILTFKDYAIENLFRSERSAKYNATHDFLLSP
jgi:hypothetical protein